jgi:hypothetical protein
MLAADLLPAPYYRLLGKAVTNGGVDADQA